MPDSTMTITRFFNVPDEHALRLGRLVARWSAVEFLLDGMIWEIAGLPVEDGDFSPPALMPARGGS